MKDIALHINYLLLRHNWLAVTGFGAFVCEYKAAFFDEESNTWFPPCRRVRFIAGKFPEDNILLKSLLKKYDVSVREAREMINSFADETISEIQLTGKCEYPGLGKFHKTDAGNIVFKSEEKPEQVNAQLGFEPIDLSSLSQTNSEIYSLPEEDDELTNELAGKFNVDKNYYLPINKQFFRSAACILLFVLMSLSFVVPTNVAPQIGFTASTKAQEIETPVSHESTAKPATSTQAAAVATITEDEIANNDPADCKYHLIVGTFSNEAEARKYIAMQEGGEYELTLLPTKTLYRVACASSDRFDELQQELNSSRLRTNYKEAWIWSAKK